MGGAVEGKPCALARVRSDHGARRAAALFAGLSFEARRGRGAASSPGPNGAGKSSLLRAVAGFLPLAGGQRSRSRAATPERTVGEQAHYLGHADALKSALTAGENLAFWAGALGGDSAPRGVARGARRGSASPMSPISRCARCPPGRSGASRWPGSWSRRGRSGCSTSRRPRSTPPRRRLRRVMREHLAAGGLIVAATHAPLGPRRRGAADPRRRSRRRERRRETSGLRRLFLREWRIARPHRRRRVGRRGVLPHPRRRSCRSRSGPTSPAGAARPGDPVDRGAARDPARPRPAVPGRRTTTARST